MNPGSEEIDSLEARKFDQFLVDIRKIEGQVAAVAGASNNEPMAENPSRDEINAKLEAVEARLETRVVRIEGKIDQMIGQLQDRKEGVASLRWWLIGSALTILLACIATAVGIQQMTVQTFQAASQQPPSPPVIIQVPQPTTPATPPPSR